MYMSNWVFQKRKVCERATGTKRTEIQSFNCRDCRHFSPPTNFLPKQTGEKYCSAYKLFLQFTNCECVLRVVSLQSTRYLSTGETYSSWVSERLDSIWRVNASFLKTWHEGKGGLTLLNTEHRRCQLDTQERVHDNISDRWNLSGFFSHASTIYLIFSDATKLWDNMWQKQPAWIVLRIYYDHLESFYGKRGVTYLDRMRAILLSCPSSSELSAREFSSSSSLLSLLMSELLPEECVERAIPPGRPEGIVKGNGWITFQHIL